MTHFILIYWLMSNNALIATPNSIVFDDKAACEDARQSIADTWKGPYHVSLGLCVPQATPAPVVVYPTPAPDLQQ